MRLYYKWSHVSFLHRLEISARPAANNSYLTIIALHYLIWKSRLRYRRMMFFTITAQHFISYIIHCTFKL